MTDISTVEALQLFDALPSHIEDALRASIERFGVLVPVVKDQNGRIIDGHHRSRIADRLGVEYRVDVVEVADEDEAREVARTLNSDRRQLTEEQRREVVRVLRERGYSIRGIAGALKVGKSTVADDIAGLSAAGQLDEPDRVVRQGGGSYPAHRPALVVEPVSTRVDESIHGDLPAGQELGNAVLTAFDEMAQRRAVMPAEPNVTDEPESGDDATEEATPPSRAIAEPGTTIERPRPPKWDPEERRRHEEEVARIRDIDAARDQAKTIVTDVLSMVLVVVAGYRCGETGLVTREMVTKLREAIDMLEGEL